MKKCYLLCCLFLGIVGYSQAQLIPSIFRKERGSFKKDVNIKPNASPKKEDKKKSEFDELEDETPITLKVNDQFSPKKEENKFVSEPDTIRKLKEGTPLPVEVEEVMYIGTEGENTTKDGEDEDDDSPLVNEDWVKIAGYYSVWDSRQIDPYNINQNDFDDVIDLHLFDPSKNQMWSMPLEENKVTSVFGPRGGRMHSGIDLDLETGDPIYSAFDGMIRIAGWDGGGYGRFVLVRHYNGLETLYGHMSKNDIVVTGQIIKAGDLIGLGGNTGRSFGSHLHFETRYEGNPFSPQHIFEFNPNNAIKGEHFLLTPEIFRNSYSNLRNEYGSAGEKVRVKKVHWYKVRSGDTLAEIAARAGIPVSKLAKKNRMTTRSTIRPGQRIRIK